jgi:hypothetical protein
MSAVAVTSALGLMFKPIDTAVLPEVAGGDREDTGATATAGVFGTPVTVSYQWQRSGVDILGATSPNYTPTAADVGHALRVRVSASNGTLVKQVFSDYTPATVLPAIAGLTFTDLTHNRIYQRATDTGGLFDKGAATVRVPISLTRGVAAIEFRVTDDTTSGVIQNWTTAATNVPGSATFVDCTVPARLGWNRIQLRVGGDDTQVVAGANRFGVGRIIAMCGQSQAVRQIFRSTGYTGTMSSNGVTVSPFGMVYATFADGIVKVTPVWALPADGTDYSSTFAGEILARNVTLSGVNCALAGHAVASTPIATWQPGQFNNTNLTNVLDGAGGFEAMYYHQGGTDAGNGTSGQAYTTSLQIILDDLAANHNAARGSNFRTYLTTMATRTSGGAGTAEVIQDIRKSAKDWCAANNATYLEPHDIHLMDHVHQGQTGSARLARHLYRAMRPAFGLPGDDVGPTVLSAVRAAGSNEVTLTCSLPSGATQLVLEGAAHTRFQIYPSGYTANPLTYATENPISVSGTTITLRLASTPDDLIALDVYVHNHPDPSAALAATDMIYDDHTNGDGLTFGRHIMPSWGIAASAAAPGGLSAPQNTSVPTLLGNPQTGQTIRSSDGMWANYPTSITYQWQRDGADLAGQTANTYVVQAADEGTYLRCVVTATNAAGSASVNSEQSSIVSAPLPGLFAFDSFSDVSGSLLSTRVPDLGATGWAALVGGFTINDGRARSNVQTSTMSMTVTPPAADYKVEAQLRMLSDAGNSTYVAARVTNSTTMIIGGYRVGHGWSAGPMVSGSYTQVVVSAATLVVGTTYLIRLEVQGTAIRLYVDNQLVGQGTSSSISAVGTPGLRNSIAAPGATTGLHWDNFSVAAF